MIFFTLFLISGVVEEGVLEMASTLKILKVCFIFSQLIQTAGKPPTPSPYTLINCLLIRYSHHLKQIPVTIYSNDQRGNNRIHESRFRSRLKTTFTFTFTYYVFKKMRFNYRNLPNLWTLGSRYNCCFSFQFVSTRCWLWRGFLRRVITTRDFVPPHMPTNP